MICCYAGSKIVVSIYLVVLRIVVSTKYSTEKGEKERRSFASCILEAHVNERNESSHLSFLPALFSSTLTRDSVVFCLAISISLI